MASLLNIPYFCKTTKVAQIKVVHLCTTASIYAAGLVFFSQKGADGLSKNVCLLVLASNLIEYLKNQRTLLNKYVK